MKCRGCCNSNIDEILDLGTSPPSNKYLVKDDLKKQEIFYPLKVFFCKRCFLVQAEKFSDSDELFNDDYAYFSSYSSSFLEHSKKYVELISNKLSLSQKSFVIEVACNDGYLLQYFKKKKIPCMGIEPTSSTATVAKKRGIPVIQNFLTNKLGKKLKKEKKIADLIIANNVLAHVPDINDFVLGLDKILKKNGTITFEFPSLDNLVKNNLWDTVYHEHYSYLSLSAVNIILKRNNLKIYDVEKITTHGGSYRVYVSKVNSSIKQNKSVNNILMYEKQIGIKKLKYYKNLQKNANHKKFEISLFLLNKQIKGKKVVGYGAAAKGATMLNFCGIKSDLISYVIDNNPNKQNKYFPGNRIPILSEKVVMKASPDYIIILPWNIKDEIISKLISYKKTKFVVFFPKLKIIN